MAVTKSRNTRKAKDDELKSQEIENPHTVVVMGIEEDGEPSDEMPLGETQAYGYGQMNSYPKAVRGFKVLNSDGEIVFCRTI